MTLGLNDDKYPPIFGPSLSLQQKIRLSAVNYLKENIMGLPNLPSEAELVKLQENRRLNFPFFLIFIFLYQPINLKFIGTPLKDGSNRKSWPFLKVVRWK